MLASSLVIACASTSAPSADATSPPPDDPFAPMPDTSEGLTNTSPDLEAVLEHGALHGACDRYRAGSTDRRSMLMCGKEIFFYEGLAGSEGGIPAVVPKFLVSHFPDDIGPGFTKLGMITDPDSPDELPIGLAPQPATSPPAVVFTCASCHFAQLADGRYAVGAPHHDWDYGRTNLALAVFPLVAVLGKPEDHDPQAIAAIQPLLDRVHADPILELVLVAALSSLAGGGASAPAFPPEAEHDYATWRSGTMDFVIEPLPINDHVHTVTKMMALWGLPRADEIAHSGMTRAMIGWAGVSHDLVHFAEDFAVSTGGTADWPDERLMPLVEYVYTLRAPSNPAPIAAELVARGRALFAAKGCLDCHGAPRGAGKRVYSFDEIGTDSALAHWLDPDLTGTPCCGAPIRPDEPLTHGVKSPRINGTWTMTRFLHNGSLSSLDELFCLAPRPAVSEPPFSAAGHRFTCDDLIDDDKRALIAYLLAN